MNETQLGYAQVLRTPAGAAATITRLRQNGCDLATLNSMTTLTADPECWRCLRDAGIVDPLLDMILQTPYEDSSSQTVGGPSKKVDFDCGK